MRNKEISERKRYFDRCIVGWLTVQIKKTVLEYVIRNRQE